MGFGFLVMLLLMVWFCCVIRNGRRMCSKNSIVSLEICFWGWVIVGRVGFVWSWIGLRYE